LDKPRRLHFDSIFSGQKKGRIKTLDLRSDLAVESGWIEMGQLAYTILARAERLPKGTFVVPDGANRSQTGNDHSSHRL
jgi:hypothetical protein